MRFISIPQRVLGVILVCIAVTLLGVLANETHSRWLADYALTRPPR